MPLAVTCVCGARLEIDDAFAGKVIPCPDCQRPLATTPPARPDQRTSNLAALSLFLSLAGALTLVGSLAGAVVGWLGLRQIDRSQGKLAGAVLARAGIFLGLGFTALTALLLVFPVGLDGMLRVLEWAGKLDYSAEKVIHKKTIQGNTETITPPSVGWGRLPTPEAEKADDVILVNVFEDAHLVVLSQIPEEIVNEDAQARKIGLEMLRRSDLVSLLQGELRPAQEQDEPQPSKETPAFVENDDLKGSSGWDEFTVDVRLGGHDRTFLIRVKREESVVLVLAAVTRKASFQRLETILRKALDSFEWTK